jgi:hypothetical protein
MVSLTWFSYFVMLRRFFKVTNLSICYRWYWRGKPEGSGQMDNTIATRPIGIHKYKETRMIRELDQQFYGPANNKEIKKLNPRSRAFVDNVRKNLGIDK